MELLQCLQSTLHPGCSQFNDRFSLTDIQQIYSTLEAITRYQPYISLEAVVSSATLFIYIINYERKSFDLWKSFKYEIGLYIIYKGLLQQKRVRAKPFLEWMKNWNMTIFLESYNGYIGDSQRLSSICNQKESTPSEEHWNYFWCCNRYMYNGPAFKDRNFQQFSQQSPLFQNSWKLMIYVLVYSEPLYTTWMQTM